MTDATLDYSLTGVLTSVADLAESLDLDALDDWREAVRRLHHIRDARKSLATSESLLERHCAHLMQEAKVRDPQEIDGVGVVQLRKGTARKTWDHASLTTEVLHRHLSQSEGEIPAPWTVRDWLLDALAPNYWRAGVLRDLGIDPDDYCAATPGRATVQITANGAGK